MKLWRSLFVLIIIAALLMPHRTSAETTNQLNYVALGDSITAGLGASEVNYIRKNAYVPQLTAYLRETNTVNVRNHAIPGLSSFGLAFLLEFDKGLQQELNGADLITLSIGGNDFLFTLRTFDNSAPQVVDQQFRLTTMAIDRIIQKIRELNPKATLVLLGLYNPYPPNSTYNELAATFVQKHNKNLSGHANKNTLIIDPFDEFRGRETELTLINEDDIHPNDKGYDVIVNLIKEQLNEQKAQGS